jgi:predicted Zn-dependent protease
MFPAMNRSNSDGAPGAFRKVILMMLSFTVILISCQTSPTGRRQLMIMPSDQMDAMGAQAFQEMKTQQTVERDAALNSYVRCVSQAITDAMEERRNWEVVVFRDNSANAFALPGGKIGVHTGLLKVAVTPAQLAAVIGHEVGHVIAEHGNERVSQQFAAQGGLALVQGILSTREGKDYSLLMGALGLGTQFGVLMPFGRAQESEADKIGLELMARAGFDPRESVELWKNMAQASGGSPPEFLSTHPSPDSRIRNLQDNMEPALNAFNSTTRRPACRRNQ